MEAMGVGEQHSVVQLRLPGLEKRNARSLVKLELQISNG